MPPEDGTLFSGGTSSLTARCGYLIGFLLTSSSCNGANHQPQLLSIQAHLASVLSASEGTCVFPVRIKDRPR